MATLTKFYFKKLKAIRKSLCTYFLVKMFYKIYVCIYCTVQLIKNIFNWYLTSFVRDRYFNGEKIWLWNYKKSWSGSPNPKHCLTNLFNSTPSWCRTTGLTSNSLGLYRISGLFYIRFNLPDMRLVEYPENKTKN